MDFTPHHHAEPEIYFGLEGAGTVVVDGVGYDLAPGVVLHIPSNAVHGIPQVTAPLRFLYVFAADSFEDIVYTFKPSPG